MKLVARKGAEAVKVLGDLYPDVTPYQLATPYVLNDDTLYRLDGPRLRRLIKLPAESLVELIGADRAGFLIAAVEGRLVRWSPRGGWRLLLE